MATNETEATTTATPETTPAATGDVTLTAQEQSFMEGGAAPQAQQDAGETQATDQAAETAAQPAPIVSAEDALMKKLAPFIQQTIRESLPQHEQSQQEQQLALGIDNEVKGLAAILGEDAAGPLKAFGDKIAKSVSAIISQNNQQVQRAQNYMAQMQFERAIDSLKPRFPQLAEEGVLEDVQKRALKLARSGDYEDMHSVVSDAARIVLFDRMTTDQQKKNAIMNRAKSQGQPMTPGRAANGTFTAKPKTFDDRADAFMETYDKTGGNLDKAKAAASAAD